MQLPVIWDSLMLMFYQCNAKETLQQICHFILCLDSIITIYMHISFPSAIFRWVLMFEVSIPQQGASS